MRTVAGIFGCLGWVTLIVCAIGILALFLSVGHTIGPNGGAVAVAGIISSLVSLVLLALGPFFFWALLTALCELHAHQDRMLEGLDDLVNGIDELRSDRSSRPLPRPGAHRRVANRAGCGPEDDALEAPNGEEG